PGARRCPVRRVQSGSSSFAAADTRQERSDECRSACPPDGPSIRKARSRRSWPEAFLAGSRQPYRSASGAHPPSVAAVALFLPGIAAPMVAKGFPESELLPLFEPKALDPLGALPEIEVGHDQPGRTAVLGRQRFAVGLIGNERLVIHQVGDWQIGGEAAV